MPKIIVTSRFIRAGNHSKLNNYIKYIATRKGVELTKNAQLIPDLDREIYINYLGTRPDVVKQGAHGLFSDTDKPIILDKAGKEVAQHNGTVWTHIVSLKREDAERMGYNTLDMWRDLVRRHIVDIADAQKISVQNIRWYAAFHNKESNPHVHIVIYSVDPKEGYLTNAGIEKIRSAFANDIYRDELQNLYQQQTKVRNGIRNDAEQLMNSLVEDLKSSDEVNPVLQDLIIKLSAQLRSIKGKKVYGYLQPMVKKTVDKIVAEIAKTPALQKMYEQWCELEKQKYSAYTSVVPCFPPLHENKVFKPIKNRVVDIVSNMNLTFNTTESAEKKQLDIGDIEMECVINDDKEAVNIIDSIGHRNNNALYEQGKMLVEGKAVLQDIKKGVDMLTADAETNQNARYYLAKLYLNGEGVEQNIEKVVAKLETCTDNPYAMYALAKLYLSGELPKNVEKVFELLTRACENGNSMGAYALGKLYLYGSEVERDIDAARYWFTQAANMGNEYAANMLQNLDRHNKTAVNNAVLSMLFSFGRLISDDYERKSRTRFVSERKLKAAIRRKKEALGLKDDHTVEQQY
ncbi:MAG: MobP3 family relaxase [Ruminiclostridium sp.]